MKEETPFVKALSFLLQEEGYKLSVNNGIYYITSSQEDQTEILNTLFQSLMSCFCSLRTIKFDI